MSLRVNPSSNQSAIVDWNPQSTVNAMKSAINITVPLVAEVVKVPLKEASAVSTNVCVPNIPRLVTDAATDAGCTKVTDLTKDALNKSVDSSFENPQGYIYRFTRWMLGS